MEEYIADLMSYKQLQEKVLKNEQNIAIMAPDDDNTLGVVVPDMGSYGGNPPYVPGKAGLVNLYNRSSGLELDIHGRLIISRASNSEVIAGVSNNNPIVPATISLAMQSHSFKGDISQLASDDENTPPSAKAVKDFVENHTPTGGTVETYTGDIAMANGEHAEAHKPPAAYIVREYGDYLTNLITPNLLNFNIAIIEKGDRFEIKPGMFGLVLPYGGQTLTSWDAYGNPIVQDNDGNAIGIGTTIFFSTDNDKAGDHWCAMLYLSTISMKNHHSLYKGSTYLRNDYSGSEGTGRAYVYYTTRKGV